jgi:hypothetical protein
MSCVVHNRRVAALVLLFAGLFLTPAATAAPLSAGWDLFASPPGLSSVTVDGFGLISLQGVPIDPGLFGDGDTIVQRTNPVGTGGAGCDGMSPIPAGCEGTYDIELVALFLRSVTPVLTGGGLVDVYVTINALGLPSIPVYDTLDPSTGMLTVLTHDDALGGGTMESVFNNVQANIIVTIAGGDPRNLGNVLTTFTHDTGELIGSGVWSHTPRPDDPRVRVPEVADRFPAGGFYPGVDPVTNQKVLTPEEAALAAHGVLPAQVPEPSTWLLLGGGLAALTPLWWRSRKRNRR